MHARALERASSPPRRAIVTRAPCARRAVSGDLLAPGARAGRPPLCAQQVGVVAAAEPAVARHARSGRCRCSSRRASSGCASSGEAGHDRGEHLGELLGVGPRALRRLLRAAQLRRGDHLHGLGDLLRASGPSAIRLRMSLRLGIERYAVKRLRELLERARRSSASTSSVSSFFSRIAVSTSGCLRVEEGVELALEALHGRAPGRSSR